MNRAAERKSMLGIVQRKAIAFEHRAYLKLRARADQRVATWARQRSRQPKPEHLRIGERGEELALLHLRERGYTVVARRWRTARLRGDLDLVAWDGDSLVIFEIKTRTARDFAPAESAVDGEKQRMLRRMALAYKRRLPEPWRDHVSLRFDVLSVYDLPAGPEFEHIPGAFPLIAQRRWRGWRSGAERVSSVKSARRSINQPASAGV